MGMYQKKELDQQPLRTMMARSRELQDLEMSLKEKEELVQLAF